MLPNLSNLGRETIALTIPDTAGALGTTSYENNLSLNSQGKKVKYIVVQEGDGANTKYPNTNYPQPVATAAQLKQMFFSPLKANKNNKDFDLLSDVSVYRHSESAQTFNWLEIDEILSFPKTTIASSLNGASATLVIEIYYEYESKS